MKTCKSGHCNIQPLFTVQNKRVQISTINARNAGTSKGVEIIWMQNLFNLMAAKDSGILNGGKVSRIRCKL